MHVTISLVSLKELLTRSFSQVSQELTLEFLCLEVQSEWIDGLSGIETKRVVRHHQVQV